MLTNRFGKSTRGSTKNSEEPGPGYYDYSSVYNSTVKRPPSVTENLTQFVMGIKVKNLGDERTPGPAYYKPEVKLVKSRVVGSALDKNRRSEVLRPQSANVGPGSYEFRSKIPGPYYG